MGDSPSLHRRLQDGDQFSLILCLSKYTLPDGWSIHTDPATQRKFYWNASSGVSQWEAPEGAVLRYDPPRLKDVIKTKVESNQELKKLFKKIADFIRELNKPSGILSDDTVANARQWVTAAIKRVDAAKTDVAAAEPNAMLPFKGSHNKAAAMLREYQRELEAAKAELDVRTRELTTARGGTLTSSDEALLAS